LYFTIIVHYRYTCARLRLTAFNKEIWWWWWHHQTSFKYHFAVRNHCTIWSSSL